VNEHMLKRSFDWMAKPYAALERLLFGGSFQAARTGLLPTLDGVEHVLVLGEGDGRFISALLARNPRARAVVVDGSVEMLAKARSRCGTDATRIDFVHANAVDWLAAPQSRAPFDAIVTTFFLDCLTESEVTRLFAAAGPRLTPGALWLWADLVVPDRGWRRYFAKGLLGCLYAAFALTTNITARRLVDPRPHFAALGWSTRCSDRALAGVLEARVLTRSSPTAPASRLQEAAARC
jgi:SAM-dependent methyltransferase